MKSAAAILILSTLSCITLPGARAQALPAGGSLQSKWQLGVAGSLVNSGYINTTVPGGMIYGNYTPMRFFSLDARTHYAYQSGGEREFSFSGGYRFNFPLGHVTPYAGGLVGVGHFTDAIPTTIGNGAHSFIISYLAGIETPISSHLNFRILEVEAQVWTGFPQNPNTLNPVLYSMGIAYHR